MIIRRFLFPLSVISVALTASSFSTYASTSLAEVPIDNDEYTEALHQLGFNIYSVDKRPFDPVNGLPNSNYKPQETFITPVVQDQLGFTNFPKSEENQDYLFYQTDPYGLSENQLPLESTSYIDNQNDLSAEQSHSFGKSVVGGEILRSNIHRATFLYGQESKLFASGSAALELVRSGGIAKLHLTFDTPQGKVSNTLHTDTGSNFPIPSDEKLKQTHRLDSTFLDIDGDGYSELLAASYNGRVYVFTLENLTDSSSGTLLASYALRPEFSKEEYGSISLAKGEFRTEPGEQLIFLKRTYAYPWIPEDPAKEYHCFEREVHIVKLGTEGYNTLINNPYTELSEYFCPQAIASAKINGQNRDQLILGGVHVDVKRTLGTHVININEIDSTTYSSEPFAAFDWSESKWKEESFYAQTSIAAADLLGIGQDYIAYASKIFVFDPSRANKLSKVGRWDLGEASNVTLEWRVGNFAEDFSEYQTKNNLLAASPSESQLVRSEGEELILARINRDNDKYSLRTVQLIDVDNSTFEDVVDINGGFYGYKSGLNRAYISQPTFFPTSRVEIATNYHSAYPSLNTVDPNQVSINAKYVGGHEVKVSAPILIEAMDPVPYYANLFESMKPNQEFYHSTETGESYSLTSTSSAGTSSGITTPVFSYAISSTVSEIFSQQLSVTKTTSNTAGNTTGDAFLHFEVTPYDSYEYKILSAPNELADAIGTATRYMFPRTPLSSYVNLSTYNQVNDETGGKLFSYDHLFAPKGIPLEYPGINDVYERYPDAQESTYHSPPPTPDQYLEVGMTVTTYLEEGQGSGESLSQTAEVGLNYRNFGFSNSKSYTKGLETLTSRSWSGSQGYYGRVNGFEISEEFPVYEFGMYMATDTNIEGAEEDYIKIGFFMTNTNTLKH
ncbi:hypothetical protein EJ063_03250 [Vibrio aquaticus]|uniref:Insecticide toxin TcdB middle/N-terminal domain-containing protein n=1 Tax=Vibrio aquaticus TaxID=2496559 RepID=A0A3S0P8P4_9VIBR|nr:hypothetical protein [Vibrio aquaticus]RTZ17817.1 hypothetical protein EJ063_03250 [Vibrio aquaticus]